MTFFFSMEHKVEFLKNILVVVFFLFFSYNESESLLGLSSNKMTKQHHESVHTITLCDEQDNIYANNILNSWLFITQSYCMIWSRPNFISLSLYGKDHAGCSSKMQEGNLN